MKGHITRFLLTLFMMCFFSNLVYAAEQELIYTQTFEINATKVHQSFLEFKTDKIGIGTLVLTKNDPKKQFGRGHIFFNGKVISIQKFLLDDQQTVFMKEVQIKATNKFLIYITGMQGTALTLAWKTGAPPPPEEIAKAAAKKAIDVTAVRGRMSYSILPNAPIKSENEKLTCHEFDTFITYTNFSGGYNLKYTTWGDIKKLSFGNKKDEPWKMLHSLYAGVEDEGPTSGDWFYFVDGKVSLAFEDVKDFNKSFETTLLGGLKYAIMPNDVLYIKMGGAFYHNNMKLDVNPYFLMGWNRFEKQGLTAAVGYPESNIGYRVTENFTARLNVLLNDFHIYKLSNDNPLSPDGYLEVVKNRAALFLDYKTSEEIFLNLGVSYDIRNEYIAYDKNKETYTIGLDKAIGIVAQMGYVF
ncbi:MAG: hypothetical protein HQK79_02675 [Desulfobacterales bacterium]|nr:hypothetical protein [Desulfobacterales bacterium]MBF0395520.1 hypothetical protein [Desulfobacterales bacterium]